MSKLRTLLLLSAAVVSISCMGCGGKDDQAGTDSTAAPKGAVAAPMGGGAAAAPGSGQSKASIAPKPGTE